jgi:hypothetical protein
VLLPGSLQPAESLPQDQLLQKSRPVLNQQVKKAAGNL